MTEQLNSEVQSTWTAGSNIWWQGIPTSPRIRVDGDSSPQPARYRCLCGRKSGQPRAHGGRERGEPHTSLRSAVGKLGLQPAPSAQGQCEVSPGWELSAQTHRDRSPHTARATGRSIRIGQEAGWAAETKGREHLEKSRGETGPQLSRLVGTTGEEPWSEEGFWM